MEYVIDDEIDRLLRRMDAEQSTYAQIKSALIDEKQVEEAESSKPLKIMQDFLDAPLVGDKDSDMKKLFAAGVALAKDKGVLPFDMPNGRPETIVGTVDGILTHAKLAYQVANGKIQSEEVFDKLTDSAVSVTMAVAGIVIEKGAPVVVEGICDAVSCVCPPAAVTAQAAKPLLKRWAKHIAPKVKESVKKAIKTIATYAKTTVKTTVKTIMTTSFGTEKTILNRLKNLLFG